MDAKQNGASECADVGHARTLAHQRGALMSAEGPGSGVRAASEARGEASGVAANRWARRMIAGLVRRAVRLARRGQARRALSILRRLADITPSVPLVQLCLARIACSLGDMQAVVDSVHAVLATTSTKACRYHCRVAVLLLRLQELAGAEACLERARHSFPDSLRVWLLLGELYRYRGRHDDAIGCYNRALALAETNGERLQALAGLAGCCADTGRTDDAVAVSRRMIDLCPDSAQGYCHLVNCQRGASPPDDAIEPMVQMLSSKSLPRGQRLPKAPDRQLPLVLHAVLCRDLVFDRPHHAGRGLSAVSPGDGPLASGAPPGLDL
jgi:tetratricopeptide (TPR) repeat protein